MRRRDAIKGMVAGMGAAVTGAGAAGTATAQTSGPGAVVGSEHWARKGDVSLYLFRKRLAPRAGEPARPVLILVHGSSNSSRSSFDLTVPGAGRYSVMVEVYRHGDSNLSGYDVIVAPTMG